jgi:hypothetical protein
MIDVKQAVTSAVASANDLLGDRQIRDVALEEVQMSEDGRLWLITIGFYAPPRPDQANTLSDLFPRVNLERQFKMFEVDAETGKVKSMKIRKV